ncbi:dehydrogenase/reductase SDR family member 4-like isoform X1 [Mercenaria mercenaria]|uniref:dehydrogenase/reductase SDR family member 4-like isoform X1 n=2 Tax=Mercenaria mercenaria TaxID=6596 RepID=UPI00234F2ADF|nr:dehydrogenase/reductase SDR family member 4-like isoform X1 [Mercenaria mercenaria]
MGKLTGKVAIVTASSYGIGLSIAERLAEDGAKVMISSRKQQNVDKALQTLKNKGLTVSGVVCHVAKKEHRQKLIEQTVNEYGGIDLLVSNAAVNPIFGPMLNSTEDAWDKIFEVNVKSTFFLIKEIVPYMEKRGGGSMVIVSSASGYIPIVGSKFTGAYSTSKTALFGMAKAVARQLARMNIRVNCIAPGLIKTKFSEILAEHEGEEIIKVMPLKRFGEPSECAGIVSFLLSADASYITGETVGVTGGISSRL